MRNTWSLTDALRVETRRFTTIRSPRLRRWVRRSMEREVQRNDRRDQETQGEYSTNGENKGGPSFYRSGAR